MPSYVTDIADIQLWVPDLDLTTSTKPTSAQVLAEMVTGREAQLHQAVRAAGYDTPLTHAEDVAYASLLVQQIVAADVYVAAFGWGDLPEVYQNYRADWKAFLKDLKTSGIQLAGDTPESDEYPAFGIVRQPTRDSLFTERYNRTDWNE